MKYAKKKSPTKINKRVEKLVRKKQISNKDFAAMLGKRGNSMHYFYNRLGCDIDLLWDISKALDYNFFREIAQQINIVAPESSKTDELQQKIKMQEIEINLLKECIQLLGGKKV